MSTPNSCSEHRYQELDKYIDSLPSLQGALVAVLHHAQELYGYLPHELQRYIAHRLNVPTAQVYGVVSFYSFFTMNPKGKHNINVCMGTACFVGGAEAVLREFERILEIKNGETTPDNVFTLGQVRCVGACGLAPVVMIDDRVYARVNPQMVPQIIAEYRSQEVASNA